MIIKHISLDFWNTIATPNIAFGKARNKFLSDVYNLNSGFIRHSYLQAKSELDDMGFLENELGTTVTSAWCHFENIVAKDYPDMVGTIFDCNVIEEVAELFLKYPPNIMDEFVEFTNNRTVGLNITSNTNFIGGETIMMYLDRLGLNMDFCIFSDMVGYSKPRTEIFEIVHNQAASGAPLDISDILHMGDSFACDVYGAWRYGFNACHLDDPTKLMKVINYYV